MKSKSSKMERMWKHLRYLCVGLGATIVLSGCSIRTADMTVITTRMVALDRVDLDKLPTKQRVTGEATAWHILLIPLGFPKLKDAVDDALNKGGGDLMTDAVVTQGVWTTILFGRSHITIVGDVVKTRNN